MIQCSSAATSISNYRSIFDSALEAYRKKTKSDLASHPLLTKIESCDCPETILTALRGEIFGAQSDNKSSTWLNSTVKILYTLSSTIGESVGLVRYRCYSK